MTSHDMGLSLCSAFHVWHNNNRRMYSFVYLTIPLQVRTIIPEHVEGLYNSFCANEPEKLELVVVYHQGAFGHGFYVRRLICISNRIPK